MKTVHDFFVSDEPDEAVRKIKVTLNKVGELNRVEPLQFIEGKIAFGVLPVQLHITWAVEDATTRLDKEIRGGAAVLPAIGTRIIVTATADDNTQAAQQNAIERFEDAYRHFDRDDYRPDRMGLMPITIIGILVTLILLAILLWRIPSFRKSLPQITPAVLKDKDQSKPADATDNKDDKTDASSTSER
jgi:hypothetical protein